VSEQQIIVRERRSIGTIERGVPRLLKVLEREAVQLAGYAARGEERFDEIGRAIGRAGIADHPTIDVVDEGAETALKIRRLVLDDHVEAKRFRIGHRQDIKADCLLVWDCRLRDNKIFSLPLLSDEA